MNSIEKGDRLEIAIERTFNDMLKAGDFWGNSKLCSVHRKKGYYSKDREKDIVFDVSIECCLPGADRYSMVTLIECKNYSHPVPVDDVEEFFAKAQQVATANSKLILASTAAFQDGTVKFAKSKGIALLRYLSDTTIKWELFRSPSAGPVLRPETTNGAMQGIIVQEITSSYFDFCMLSPTGATHSFWDFFEDFYLSNPDDANTLVRFRNPRGKPSPIVPYLEQEAIEDQCDVVLQQIGYREGEVSLDAICAREAAHHGLAVVRNCVLPVQNSLNPVLGQISFSPLEIRLFDQLTKNRGRDRFTLAHELAHHLLSHGNFMVSEFCDESDFFITRDRSIFTADVARLEVQANLFAAYLLMPKRNFKADFHSIIKWLGLPNRGYGTLFLDEQMCNYQSFQRVTTELMGRYGVSREAAEIRLKTLGLLRDVRTEAIKDLLGHIEVN